MSGLILFLASFIVLLLAVALMAIGVIASRPDISGGLSKVPGVTSECGGACRRSCPRRPEP